MNDVETAFDRIVGYGPTDAAVREAINACHRIDAAVERIARAERAGLEELSRAAGGLPTRCRCGSVEDPVWCDKNEEDWCGGHGVIRTRTIPPGWYCSECGLLLGRRKEEMP